MTLRIGLIHVSQETNDFNPRLTTLADYRAFGLHQGAEVIEKAGSTGQVAGHLRAVAESGLAVETVPIVRAHAVAGGRIDRESHQFFLDRIREGLSAAGRLDGLALYLHGACAAEGEDDVEGVQAALCREILGPDVPILLGLDHHANVTRRMVGSVTAIVGHRTQPHDQFDTGLIGTRLLLRILSERLSPRMVMRKIPLVTHQEQFLTAHGPMKTWFDRARAMEDDPRVLQAVPFPMQPWLDVDEGGWTAVVVTNGDQALAETLADELAALAWSLRDDFLVREAIGIDEAVLEADAAPEGVIVLSDTGDTVFGGAAGDSNLLLEAMLRLRIRGPALVPMVAPGVVARLFEAGEGATVTLPVGGETATAFFSPIDVTGTVRRLGGGKVPVRGYQDAEIDMGRTAVLEIGPVTLLVSELRGVAGNLPDVYRAFGIEPQDAKMVVLKTASNFQYFASMTKRVIRADTRGPGQSDVFTLPWKRLPRPIYPLERMERWDAPRTSPATRRSA
ncbi:M81 family metallopeptidase [Elioraea rosea]|uniref:M81 family metallopeptidase n=1 Tax=Elioraea rosea TaxID=2492390 RepID=UPI001183B7A9|nr:M81 family metallopeptidase [Elioraea rosea]